MVVIVLGQIFGINGEHDSFFEFLVFILSVVLLVDLHDSIHDFSTDDRQRTVKILRK